MDSLTCIPNLHRFDELLDTEWKTRYTEHDTPFPDDG
jgi:hypothetical protein